MKMMTTTHAGTTLRPSRPRRGAPLRARAACALVVGSATIAALATFASIEASVPDPGARPPAADLSRRAARAAPETVVATASPGRGGPVGARGASPGGGRTGIGTVNSIATATAAGAATGPGGRSDHHAERPTDAGAASGGCHLSCEAEYLLASWACYESVSSCLLESALECPGSGHRWWLCFVIRSWTCLLRSAACQRAALLDLEACLEWCDAGIDPWEPIGPPPPP